MGDTTDGVGGESWETDEEDDSGAVMRAVGRQIKLWRDALGMRQVELGAAIGYSEEMVSAVERARRIPKPEFLEAADKALGADGKIKAMAKDLEEARYPRKVRHLAKLEAEAVELDAYNNTVIHGLLQTEEYARAAFNTRRPQFTEEELGRRVTSRMARQAVLVDAAAQTLFTFVQCESTLRRPIGGGIVMRRQLERLLEVGQLRNVDLQVLPLSCEDNAGLGGSFRLLKLRDGTTVGQNEVQLTSRVIADPKEVQVLEMRYGIIRAQALTPRESLAFIEKVRDET